MFVYVEGIRFDIFSLGVKCVCFVVVWGDVVILWRVNLCSDCLFWSGWLNDEGECYGKFEVC